MDLVGFILSNRPAWESFCAREFMREVFEALGRDPGWGPGMAHIILDGNPAVVYMGGGHWRRSRRALNAGEYPRDLLHRVLHLATDFYREAGSVDGDSEETDSLVFDTASFNRAANDTMRALLIEGASELQGADHVALSLLLYGRLDVNVYGEKWRLSDLAIPDNFELAAK